MLIILYSIYISQGQSTNQKATGSNPVGCTMKNPWRASRRWGFFFCVLRSCVGSPSIAIYKYEKKFSKPAESSAPRRVSCRFRSLFLYSRFMRFHPLCLLIKSEQFRLNFSVPHVILRHIRLHFSLSRGNLREHSSLCPLSCWFLYFLSRCASVYCPCAQSYEVP